jgi:hypothetical protein
MVMVALIAAGGLAVVLVLADLTDYLLARAGKRSVFRRRVILDPRSTARGIGGLTDAQLERNPTDWIRAQRFMRLLRLLGT